MRLVIVGHVGVNEDRTPYGSAISPGGAAYACARGAAVIDAGQVGVVSTVGTDLNLEPIRHTGIDLAGIRVLPGRSPRFTIDQTADGRRTFTADLGVAAHARPDSFPQAYGDARHVHLATAPPEHQLAWMRHLRRCLAHATISVDMFEHFAERDGALCRKVCGGADLVFMNEHEQRILFGLGYPAAPTVVKQGPLGATHHDGGRLIRVATRHQQAVDTTHAGEIVAGVYLALSLRGLPVNVCLAHAVRAATAKVTQFGVDGDALAATLRQIRADVVTASVATG